MIETPAYLIIDDNSLDRMIASTLLTKCLIDPEIHTCETSTAAIEWLKNKRTAIHKKVVILLDMLMPDVDGFGFLEMYAKLNDALKANNEIIMLSSMEDGTDFVKRAKSNPYVKAVLDKPLSVDELQEIL